MSFSLNSLKGGYKRDSIRVHYDQGLVRGILGASTIGYIAKVGPYF